MNKRTKIVATVGPSTANIETLKNMVKEGVNVFRINFSHGTHEDHIEAIKKIKKVDEELGTHSALLADLQGPKIRIGDLPKEGLPLEKGDDFYLTTLEKHELKPAASISLQQLPKDVQKENRYYLMMEKFI